MKIVKFLSNAKYQIDKQWNNLTTFWKFDVKKIKKFVAIFSILISPVFKFENYLSIL